MSDQELPLQDTSIEAEENSAGGGVTRREIFGKTLAATAAAAASTLQAQTDNARTDSVYRIHPSIGVARLGNADPSTYFIGPEAPGYGPSPSPTGSTAPPYKVNGLVKPQGARFRVFEYRWTGSGASRVLSPYREVTLDTPGVAGINWNVHLANKKASFNKFSGLDGERGPAAGLRNPAVANRRSLEIDFGPRTVNGRSQGGVAFSPGNVPSSYPSSVPLNYLNQPVIDYLGQVRTDQAGRLIVLGGKGKAGYQSATAPDLPSYANNDGWFDDISDGPVTATVTVQTTTGPVQVPVDAAGASWVLCAPPDFAPRIRAAVTMYDLLYDLAVRSLPLPATNALYAAGGPLAKIRTLKQDYIAGANYEFPNAVPDFNTDIYPILRAGYEFYWVTALVTRKHANLMDPVLGDSGPVALKARQDFFGYMRPPLGLAGGSGPGTMPRQLGDSPYLGQDPDAIRHLALTHVQFGLLRRWADGNFIRATAGTPPAAPPLPAFAITPQGLDQAALENCAGGAFFPGIEASWQIRNPQLFIEPFRINLQATSQYLNQNGLPEGGTIGAGHFSRQMAVPWQADFNDCANEGNYAWWPSQRPDDAFPSYNAPQRLDWSRPDNRYPGGNRESTHADMVANWWKYAVVVQQAEQFVETERNSPIP